MLTVTVLPGEFPDPGFVSQWRELLTDCVFATPFQTPAWTKTWWWHFGKRKTPHWIAFHEGDDLVGLYPMYRTKYPWRALRPIGCGQSDYLHPIARKGYLQSVNAYFISHMAELDDVDVVDIQQLREGASPAAGDYQPEVQAQCLVLDLPKSYDAYLEGLSKSLRYDCRRLGKEPFTSGSAKVLDVCEEQAPQTIESFFALHEKRWKSRWQPGAFATKRLKAFHSEVVVALAAEGTLRMSVLEHEGAPVGVFYGMQVNDTKFFYQCGFDPAAKALSPGTLLVADAIRKAIGDGCTQFDFMRGDEPYKRRWNPQHSHRNLRYILPLNSGLGAVGRALNHAGSKIEERFRARLEGRSLFG